MDESQVSLLGVVSLRGAALALSLTGNSKAGDAMYSLADATEAGLAVDAHLADVAAKLKAGQVVSDADWDDVQARIKADSDRLQAVKAG